MKSRVSGQGAPIAWGKLIQEDNFNGSSLNSQRWSIYNDPNADGTIQPRRTKQSAQLRNGYLDLIGYYQQPYGFVGGGVSDSLYQTYGRWEIRFRSDTGAGWAPVILLWPKGKWPDDGEIDLAEIVNPRRLGAGEFVHLGALNRSLGHPISGSVSFAKWHTLAVDWLPDHITFWLDGKREWTVKRKTGSNNYIPSTPMRLTIQLDEGCDSGCKPAKDASLVFMQVDWIRIWAPPPTSKIHLATHSP